MVCLFRCSSVVGFPINKSIKVGIRSGALDIMWTLMSVDVLMMKRSNHHFHSFHNQIRAESSIKIISQK